MKTNYGDFQLEKVRLINEEKYSHAFILLFPPKPKQTTAYIKTA